MSSFKREWQKWVVAILVLILLLQINRLRNENIVMTQAIQEMHLRLDEQRILLETLQAQKPQIETVDYNDIAGGVYCCGWDFYAYDEARDVTVINPLSVPISIMVKGELPAYINFTKEDRHQFTFFYQDKENYYPIMSYLLVSKAAIQYGWLNENPIDPAYDLGNGFIVYLADPNVPANVYTDDPTILQRMKDFMTTVSVKVVK